MTLDEARTADPHNWEEWLAVVHLLVAPTSLTRLDVAAALQAFRAGWSPLRFAVHWTAEIGG